LPGIRVGVVVGTQHARLQGERQTEAEHHGEQKPGEEITSSLM
jgi:hypothetical protein